MHLSRSRHSSLIKRTGTGAIVTFPRAPAPTVLTLSIASSVRRRLSSKRSALSQTGAVGQMGKKIWKSCRFSYRRLDKRILMAQSFSTNWFVCSRLPSPSRCCSSFRIIDPARLFTRSILRRTFAAAAALNGGSSFYRASGGRKETRNKSETSQSLPRVILLAGGNNNRLFNSRRSMPFVPLCRFPFPLRNKRSPYNRNAAPGKCAIERKGNLKITKKRQLMNCWCHCHVNLFGVSTVEPPFLGQT